MARKVEVQMDGGRWEPWNGRETLPEQLLGREGIFGARYVGGVLEWSPLDTDRWRPCAENVQHQTVAECYEKCPSYDYRLRPNGDAPAGLHWTCGGCEERLHTQRTDGGDYLCACGHKVNLGAMRAKAITSTTEVSGEKLLANTKRAAQEERSKGFIEGWNAGTAQGEIGRVYEQYNRCLEENSRLGDEVIRLQDEGLRLADACSRANRLSDECGSLRSELNEAYAKIGRQERELERLRRKR